MKALDTNVLVRYLTRDDPDQAVVAREFIQHCSREEPGFVNTVVLIELIWALRTYYQYDKPLLIRVLETILETEQLKIENSEAVNLALTAYREHPVDFADALIGIINKQRGITKTATFDKKAAKLDTFDLLS